MNKLNYLSILLILTTNMSTINVSSRSPIQKPSKSLELIKWDEDTFTVRPIPLSNEITAIWYVTKDGTVSSSPDTSSPHDRPEAVLNVFDKQANNKKKHGIFVYSGTYAIKPTKEDIEMMSTLESKLFKNPKWRASEARLIEKLRIECKKRNIPLYVNLTLNMNGSWKKLTL